MGISSKNKKAKSSYLTSKSTVSKDVPSYANDPYFVEKAERSQKFLERVGFPEEALKILKERQAKSKKNTSE